MRSQRQKARRRLRALSKEIDMAVVQRWRGKGVQRARIWRATSLALACSSVIG